MSDQAVVPFTKPPNIPRVIGFSFQDYRANEVTKARSAECRSCGRTVKEKAGTTSNFLRHLRKHHPDLYQLYQDSKQTEAVSSPSTLTTKVEEAQPLRAKPSKPKQPRRHVEATVKSSNSIKNLPSALSKKNAVIESFVDVIIDENLPLNLGESKNFGAFLKKTSSKFELISQEAVCSALARRSSTLLADISRRLALVPSVNISVNTWSDCVKNSFVTITAHFLEDCGDDLKLTSSLLSCQRLLGSLSADRVVSAFTKILNELHIIRKLDYIIVSDMEKMKIAHSLAFMPVENSTTECVFDSGLCFDDESIWQSLDEHIVGALKAEVHESARYSELNCFSHTLGICIEDFLRKTRSIQCATIKVCSLVTVSQSNTQLHALLLQDRKSFKEAGLLLNTRKWEPTMSAVKAVISCNFQKLQQLSPPLIMLTSDELELLKELDYMMGPFLLAIDNTKCALNHTVSAVLPTVLSLYKHLLGVRLRTKYLQDAAIELADAIYCNFKGLFANVGMTGPEVEVASMHGFGDSIYMLAAVLDPTQGLQWLSDVHADESAKLILKKRVLDDIIIEAESSICLDSSSQEHVEAPVEKARKVESDVLETKVFDQAEACIQLDEYLDMVENGCEGFTCFQFWAKYRTKFHLLYPIARRVLSVSAAEPKVEHVMAYGGIMTKRKQAEYVDATLSDLILLKVNRQYDSHITNISSRDGIKRSYI